MLQKCDPGRGEDALRYLDPTAPYAAAPAAPRAFILRLSDSPSPVGGVSAENAVVHARNRSPH